MYYFCNIKIYPYKNKNTAYEIIIILINNNYSNTYTNKTSYTYTGPPKCWTYLMGLYEYYKVTLLLLLLVKLD